LVKVYLTIIDILPGERQTEFWYIIISLYIWVPAMCI